MTKKPPKDGISPQERMRTACGLMCGGRVDLETGARVAGHNICRECRIRLDTIAAAAGATASYERATQSHRLSAKHKEASEQPKRALATKRHSSLKKKAPKKRRTAA